MSNQENLPMAARLEPMLTLNEVAILIRRQPYTVRKMARLGTIPGAKKLGHEWMFSQQEIAHFIK